MKNAKTLVAMTFIVAGVASTASAQNKGNTERYVFTDVTVSTYGNLPACLDAHAAMGVNGACARLGYQRRVAHTLFACSQLQNGSAILRFSGTCERDRNTSGQ